MNDADWYEVTEGSALLQGDILKRCPVFIVSGWYGVTDTGARPVSPSRQVDIDSSALDLVVMTQSCDLANDKVEDVLLARMIAWSDAVLAEVQRGNTIFQSSKFRRHLIEGNLPGLSLLHRRDSEPSLP